MTTLLNELRWNLETAKQMGNVEWQERLEKRIKSEEKLEAKSEEVAESATELTVGDVLAAVGDDPALAIAALDAENTREKPRKSLVSKLEAIANPPVEIVTPEPEEG